MCLPKAEKTLIRCPAIGGIQHDNGVWLSSFVIPNFFRDLGFDLENFVFKPRPMGGVLYLL
ncbi:MAG: hypothetical protein A2169_10965 [Deltaproteobacteria bacterium RBG_13_47_9]|nr:MAG: hypothetical protein A2169_10965 [Deltaproteobacteria bacterium RBG_13_47_9]